MKICARCNGAVFAPNVACGYAGPVCGCAEPKTDDYPPVAGFPIVDKPKTLSDYIKESQGISTPGPVIKIDPGPPVPPAAFIYWLRGYVAANGSFDPKVVEQLNKVHL